MKSFFRNVLYSGIQDRLNSEDQVRILFVNSIIFFGLIVLGIFGVRDVVGGDFTVGAVTLGASAIIIGLFFTIRLTRSIAVGAWFLPFFMFAFYGYLAASGGANSSGVLWSLTYPLVAVFLVGAGWGSLFAGLYLAFLAAVFFVPGLSPYTASEIEFKFRVIGSYVIIFTFSMAFETIRRRAQEELARLAGDLAQAKVQTDGILNSVTEGIFLLDGDGRIGDQHSASLAGLLGVASPAGQSLTDLLTGRIGGRDLLATQDYLQMFFQPDPPWHLLQDINPLSEITFASPDGHVRHLTFAFAPVTLPLGRRVLGTVRDITQAWELGLKLKEEEDRSARQMKHLFQIIHVKPELLMQFLQDADEEITAVNRRLKDPKADPEALVEDLFQSVHAVKGNASLVGLSAFANRVHELETRIQPFRGQRPTWQDFLDITVRLSIIQAELTEIRELLNRMATFQRGLEASSGGRDLLLMTLEKAVDKLKEEFSRPISLDLNDFRADVVPERHRKLLKDVLVQFVRNSFAHGFEDADTRRRAGKAQEPRIRVSLKPEGPVLHMAYWDDGRGMDPAQLKAAAGAPAHLSESEALELAFVSGVSTAAEAGVHAGRGVGLGLVRERVEAAGGKLKLRSVPGRGVAFDITLPMA